MVRLRNSQLDAVSIWFDPRSLAAAKNAISAEGISGRPAPGQASRPPSLTG